jgi:hypothetical protein
MRVGRFARVASRSAPRGEVPSNWPHAGDDHVLLGPLLFAFGAV